MIPNTTMLSRLSGRFWMGAKLGKIVVRSPSELRYVWQWRKAYTTNCSAIQDRIPWITFRACNWLAQLVRDTHRVFEWGSGGSTLFWCDRVEQVVSVEHDTEWYRVVKQIQRQEEVKNCEYILAKPFASEIEGDYSSIRSPGKDFCDYVHVIDRFPNHCFDFILIDGRVRVACIRQAIPKLMPGGYLIVDNSDREDYEPAFSHLSHWPRRDFYGLGPYRRTPWATSIWHAI